MKQARSRIFFEARHFARAIRVFCMVLIGAAAFAQEAADRAPREVLAADEFTSTTWQAERMLLPGHVAKLRELTRRGGSSADMSASLERLQQNIDRFDQLAGNFAIEEYPEIRENVTRSERLMDNLAADFDAGSDASLTTTMRLLEESINRLEELAFLSDLREERLRGQFQSIYPPAWGEPKYSESAARTSLTLLDATELLALSERKRQQLLDSSARKLSKDDELAAKEIGEMARALILRQGELPPLMRPGFRNAALRMEVISDNLVDFLRDGDRANYRRQLTLLRASLRDMNDYIQIRNRMAKSEQ